MFDCVCAENISLTVFQEQLSCRSTAHMRHCRIMSVTILRRRLDSLRLTAEASQLRLYEQIENATGLGSAER